MAELIAKSPCDGLLPVKIGTNTVSEVDFGPIWSVSPLKGATEKTSKAMEAAHGVAFPAPNQALVSGDVTALWFGRAHAVLIGAEPDAKVKAQAAVTDQSDAWTVVRLEGDGAEAVLARLVPVDLRLSAFGVGQTVRSLVYHMTGSITRVDEKAFQIMVFRSLAHTLVHDLKTAMEAVAARG